MTQKPASLFDWNIVGPAIVDAFKKLNPRLMVKNPVMFVTMVGAALTTVGIFTAEPALRGFVAQLAIWLWFTVLFANFAEAVAEGRGKAQAASLRRARKDTMARRLQNGREVKVPAPILQKGDLVVCEAGDIIPADGDVIEGIASVDEAAITGESAPVIRESGGDRSAVTGGTRVLSDRIVIRVTMEKGGGFLDRMIALVEGARRQKTPNEIALTILLAALTFIFLLVCVTLKPFGIYSGTTFSVPVLVALLAVGPCLEQDPGDARAAEERGPGQRDRIVLRVDKRNVGAVREEQLRSLCLPEFGGDVQRVSTPRIGFAARVGEPCVGGEERHQR